MCSNKDLNLFYTRIQHLNILMMILRFTVNILSSFINLLIIITSSLLRLKTEYFFLGHPVYLKNLAVKSQNGDDMAFMEIIKEFPSIYNSSSAQFEDKNIKPRETNHAHYTSVNVSVTHVPD